jgi:EAL domain-containing protein (putative c-di-GMP-specific phosphodiesterase class I)/GGDEF domain-containing protein
MIPVLPLAQPPRGRHEGPMTGPTACTPEQIRTLITERRVAVHFQPIVDLHDGVVVAYEALTRPPADSGIRDVAALFHAAEQCGLIWELEKLTRGTALRAAADWPRGTRLFLNSTPTVFTDPRFLPSLLEDLRAAPDLSPQCLVLEVTEQPEDQGADALGEQVRRLVAAGFQVALDDAGAGASGLNRIMNMRPQWVKLDREFMRGIDGDMLRQNLVRFFVHFARPSGVQVLAEGIESATELQTVMSLGVRFAQGYYLGRPGTLQQTTDPAFLSDLRSRWAAVESSLPDEMTDPTLFALGRPVATCPHDAPPSHALAELARTPDAAGLAVTKEGRPAGWCSRRQLDRNQGRDVGIGSLMSTNIAVFAGETTLQEALGSILRDETERLADPIIVTNAGKPVAIVRLRDVLRIAATEGRLIASGRAGVTGLPDRSKADQHIIEQLRLWKDAGPDTSRLHADAAFIDVRSFGEFTLRFGRARTDQLVRDLAEMVSAVVLSAEPEAFLAHLGDDRFLLTAPARRLTPHLHTLAAVFDRHAFPAGPGITPPALRVLAMTNLLARAAHAGDVYRAEQRFRETARRRDAISPSVGGRSYVLESDGDENTAARRAA